MLANQDKFVYFRCRLRVFLMLHRCDVFPSVVPDSPITFFLLHAFLV